MRRTSKDYLFNTNLPYYRMEDDLPNALNKKEDFIRKMSSYIKMVERERYFDFHILSDVKLFLRKNITQKGNVRHNKV